jgi:hypothetical protein
MNASATLRTNTASRRSQARLELILLVIRLRVLDRRLAATRHYLAGRGSHSPLGQACLTSTTAKYSATLDRLRAVQRHLVD